MEQFHENDIQLDSEKRFSYLEENLRQVRQKLCDAEVRASRRAGETRLLAAVKSATAEEVTYLVRELGVTAIGENRVQQLLERYDVWKDLGAEIHFIGSLQTNKVKYLIDKVSMIHSVDSIRLAEEINRRAAARGIRMDVLAEINIGLEENKGGVMPHEASAFCKALDAMPNLSLKGLMTMAPKGDSDSYHRYFAETRRLAEDIFGNVLGRTEPPVLSMGMSESFEEAAEEGATIVRVGRTLFSDPDRSIVNNISITG